MPVSPITSATEEPLRKIVETLLLRFGASIEFWTVACLSQREFGDPRPFLKEQWDTLWASVSELRHELAHLNSSAHPALHEQVAKLSLAASDLRDVFEVLADYTTVPVSDLEAAVAKLNRLWSEWIDRVALIGSLLPLSAPLPGLESRQEVFYQDALDGLFDRFYTSLKPQSHYSL